jgi:hypothetical protein
VRTAKLTIGDQTDRGAQLLFRANGVSQMSNSHVANEALSVFWWTAPGHASKFGAPLGGKGKFASGERNEKT